MAANNATIIQDMKRFLSRTKFVNGCVEWQGRLNQGGYGRFSYKGKYRRAHRVSWQFANGREADKFVCHRCDNPKCVNPEHLFLGTAKQNSDDKIAKGRAVYTPCNTGPKRRILSDKAVSHIMDARGVVKAKILAEEFGVSIQHIYNLWCSDFIHKPIGR